MRVEIDPARCIGSTNCVEEAPGVFEVDERGLAFVVDPDADLDVVLRAARSCPVDAIRVYDVHGRRLHP